MLSYIKDVHVVAPVNLNVILFWLAGYFETWFSTIFQTYFVFPTKVVSHDVTNTSLFPKQLNSFHWNCSNTRITIVNSATANLRKIRPTCKKLCKQILKLLNMSYMSRLENMRISICNYGSANPLWHSLQSVFVSQRSTFKQERTRWRLLSPPWTALRGPAQPGPGRLNRRLARLSARAIAGGDWPGWPGPHDKHVTIAWR